VAAHEPCDAGERDERIVAFEQSDSGLVAPAAGFAERGDGAARRCRGEELVSVVA
jgi:hypothetical protein